MLSGAGTGAGQDWTGSTTLGTRRGKEGAKRKGNGNFNMKGNGKHIDLCSVSDPDLFLGSGSVSDHKKLYNKK